MNEEIENINVPQVSVVSFEEKFFALLSYFTVTVLATVVAKKDSEFCKFHAAQGVTLIVADCMFLIFTTLGIAIFPLLGFLIFFFGMISLFVLHVTGIINSLNGEIKQLPIVGKYARYISIDKLFPTTLPLRVAEPLTESKDMVGKAVEEMKNS